MGKYDSSKTRVAPVFNALLARDTTGRSWLPQLLSLPRLDGEPRWNSREDAGEIQTCAWNGKPREWKLKPPVALLALLAREVFGSKRTSHIPERQALFDGDPDALAQTLRLVEERGYVLRRWWCFEGLTSVDAYIETDKFVIVVEGKRTERGDTTHTEYMPERNQMLRNIDAAWEIRGDKRVVGFYGVEGKPPNVTEVPGHWRAIAVNTISAEKLDVALPHRDDAEKRAIKDAFLGVVTWHAICSSLGLPTDTLGE